MVHEPSLLAPNADAAAHRRSRSQRRWPVAWGLLGMIAFAALLWTGIAALIQAVV